MTIRDLPWQDVVASQIPATCRALVHSLPSSLHLLGILISPTLSAEHSTEADVVHQLQESISVGDLRLRMLGRLPVSESGMETWGLAAITIGGGLGSAMARCHFWLSSEQQTSSGPDGALQAFLPTETDIRRFSNAIKQFFLPNVRSAATSGMGMFHSLNDGWRGPLRQIAGFTILRDNPCIKAAKSLSPASRSLPEIPADWTLRPATKEDIPTILAANKIVFTAEYLESRLGISAAVASVAGDLASWALTHEDLSVAALHTKREHRGSGLASFVLRKVNVDTVQAIALSPINPYTADAPIWVHGDCEADNQDAQRWFTSEGFRPVVKNTWVLIKLDE